MISFDPNDIVTWGSKYEGPGKLPELMWWMIVGDPCLPDPSFIHMPSGSSVWQPGWDGILDMKKGNSWVPAGTSAWEFSCQKDVTGKVDELYDRRTAALCKQMPSATNIVDIATTTFVFVTSRRWVKKLAWTQFRKENGPWSDVRVWDADDLVAWLRLVPKATNWFVRQIVKPEYLIALQEDKEYEYIEKASSEFIRHSNARFNRIENMLDSAIAAGGMQTDEAESEPNPIYQELTTKIDFARDLINQKLVNTAQSELEQLLQNNGNIPVEFRFRIFMNLGMCALATEDDDGAQSWLKRAYDLQPKTPKGLASASLAAKLGKDIKGAVGLAKLARALNPRESLATAILIECLWEGKGRKQLEELISTEDWIKQDRQCVLALACVREQESRFEEAVLLYQSLIEKRLGGCHDSFGSKLLSTQLCPDGPPSDRQ